MPSKLKIIHSFEEKKVLWEEKAKEMSQSHPLKVLKKLPKMPGITESTRRFLRLKSLYYMLKEDKDKLFLRYVLKKPFKYGFFLIRSYLLKKSYKRLDDFFLYNLKNIDTFKKKLKNPKTLFVLGFSYCHKPLECPSKRFTDQCINDSNSPVCKQCFIGKSKHLLKNTQTKILIIPTVHYIGKKLFELIEKNPDKKILFLITACEMTLEMFGDWGNMLNVEGIGVRLDGRICNTMKAFILSEKGIKPGLTVIKDKTQERIMEILKLVY